MIDFPFPTSSDPNAMYEWARNFMQRFSLALQQEGSGLGGGGGAGSAYGSGYMPGHRIPWGGDVIPDGWRWENGQLLEVDSYPGLYGVYGRKYTDVSVPETLFALPDTRGRLPFSNLDSALYGGEDEFTLALENLPEVELAISIPDHNHAWTGVPHNHGVNDPGHTHGLTPASVLKDGALVDALAGSDFPKGATTGIAVNSATTGIGLNSTTVTGTNTPASLSGTTTLAGESEAISLLPPWFTCKWIVKT